MNSADKTYFVDSVTFYTVAKYNGKVGGDSCVINQIIKINIVWVDLSTCQSSH